MNFSTDDSNVCEIPEADRVRAAPTPGTTRLLDLDDHQALGRKGETCRVTAEALPYDYVGGKPDDTKSFVVT